MPVRFQVDPDFYDHPKAIGMSDSATALWARAGSYSVAKLLDGFVPEHALSLLSRVPDEAASELVARGLWRRVKGGYRFHQWDERNLTRERIEENRAYDRERKRAERVTARVTREDVCHGCGDAYVTARSDTKYCSAACRRKAHRNKPPGEDGKRPTGIPTGVQEESHRNPPAVVSVSVSESVSVSGSGHVPSSVENSRASPVGAEPPRTCPDHHADPNPPPCGQCADARRTWDTWERARLAAVARERSVEAQQRAAANAAAIRDCQMCDHRGYRAGRVCSHDPEREHRVRAGAAAARAAIRRPDTDDQEPTP